MVSPPEPISTADVARHYDHLDRFYRDIWGEHVHHGYWRTGSESLDEAVRALADVVLERAEIRPGSRVLDVGCGYGETARIVARECGAHVTGLTISPAQQRHAQEATGAGGNPQFHVEDWLNNKRSSESFDTVLAIESTEHMPEKDRVLAEMARVLRPGGRLVMVAWMAADHRASWQDRRLIAPICREGRLVGVGTPAEYVEWIASAGLRLEDERDVTSHVSKTWPALAWRFTRQLLRKPQYVGVLFDREHDNRVFVITMLRIWCAYKLRAMRMMIYTASKPA